MCKSPCGGVATRFVTEPGNGGPGPCEANETGAHQGGADETAET